MNPDINIYSHLTVCTTKGKLKASFLVSNFSLFHFGFHKKYVQKCDKKLDLLASFEICDATYSFENLKHFAFFYLYQDGSRATKEVFSAQVKLAKCFFVAAKRFRSWSGPSIDVSRFQKPCAAIAVPYHNV